MDKEISEPLKLGDRGDVVKKIQESLNDIFKPYTFFKKLNEDGYYGENTKKAIEEFQKKFGLIVNGIVDSTTFERIRYVLKNLENLVEFFNNQFKDNKILELGDQGKNVKKLQKRLNQINNVYNIFNKLVEDGYYGEKTKKAVEEFQKKFGLNVDGIAGKNTLKKIKAILNKLNDFEEVNKDNKKEDRTITVQEDILVPLKLGDTGENVKKLQKALNNLSIYYGFLGNILEDGIYGSDTEDIVRKFQKKFGLEVDGIFGEMSLNKLNSLNKALEELKLDESILGFNNENRFKNHNDINIENMDFKSEYSMRYPNFEMQFGCVNGYVTLVQKYINGIKKNSGNYFSNKEELLEDGKFGNKTLSDVRDFKKKFGFYENEKIDKNMWDKLVMEYEKVYL